MKTLDGTTALMQAVKLDNNFIVKKLLKARVDPNIRVDANIEDNEGMAQ